MGISFLRQEHFTQWQNLTQSSNLPETLIILMATRLEMPFIAKVQINSSVAGGQNAKIPNSSFIQSIKQLQYFFLSFFLVVTFVQWIFKSVYTRVYITSFLSELPLYLCLPEKEDKCNKRDRAKKGKQIINRETKNYSPSLTYFYFCFQFICLFSLK